MARQKKINKTGRYILGSKNVSFSCSNCFLKESAAKLIFMLDCSEVNLVSLIPKADPATMRGKKEVIAKISLKDTIWSKETENNADMIPPIDNALWQRLCKSKWGK